MPISNGYVDFALPDIRYGILLCVKIDYNHWQAWGLWNSRIYDSQTGYVTLDLVEVGLKLCAATELREVRRS